tara:strand:+ start:212 stop:1126 length:915 start_codon:yes stop_codon:yes gene_type:complete
VSDAELRELERRFRESGSAEDELDWLEARSRAGEVAIPFEWTTSNGGPVIVLEEAGLPYWQGASSELDPMDPESDYGRICEGEEERVNVGPTLGLVMFDAGVWPVAGWSFRDDVVLLYASSPEEAELELIRLVCDRLRMARANPEDLSLAEEPFDFLITADSRLVAFDSAFSGEEVGLDSVEPCPFSLPCRRGLYRVFPTWLNLPVPWEDQGQVFAYFMVRQRDIALGVSEAIQVAEASVTRRRKKKQVARGVTLRMEDADGTPQPVYSVWFVGGSGSSVVEDRSFSVDVDCLTGKAGKRKQDW